MFDRFDKELTYMSTTNNSNYFKGDNYYYDEGFLKVYKLLQQFTVDDYEQLLKSLSSKSNKYKEYLAYIISDKEISINELSLVIKNKITNV